MTPMWICLLTILGNVVVLTGKVDFVSDGERTFAISWSVEMVSRCRTDTVVENGHSYLEKITGVRLSA
jgi:hydroxyethylthiazole kinase-like sugar kinase family protein